MFKLTERCFLTLDGKDVFIESEPEKVAMWQRVTDRFLLQLLDDGLNNMPPSTGKALEKMNEQECTKWLKEHDFNSSVKKKFIIKASSLAITDRLGTRVSDADVLPLSLEDNSTIAGTLNILTEMQNHFRLPSDEPGPEYLPLDTR